MPINKEGQVKERKKKIICLKKALLEHLLFCMCIFNETNHFLKPNMSLTVYLFGKWQTDIFKKEESILEKNIHGRSHNKVYKGYQITYPNH